MKAFSFDQMKRRGRNGLVEMESRTSSQKIDLKQNLGLAHPKA